MLAGVCEHLQEDIHIRVHGQDEVLIHPQRQVPEHAQNLTVKIAMAPMTIMEME